MGLGAPFCKVMLTASILCCREMAGCRKDEASSFLWKLRHFCIEELVAVSYITTKGCFTQIVIFSWASAVPKITWSLLVSGIQICLAYCHMDRWLQLGGGPMLSQKCGIILTGKELGRPLVQSVLEAGKPSKSGQDVESLV